MKRTISLVLVLITVMLLVTISPVAATTESAPPFYGTDMSSWARGDISQARRLGLIPDELQNNYTSNITRAEFCALAVTLYEKITGTVITDRWTFKDTNDVNVQKAAAVGIVEGIGNNMFAPNGFLTREQAAVMLSRLADAIDMPLPRHAATFADNDRVSSWAINSVGYVQEAGIMRGVGDNMFFPQGYYTREQSIITMLRLFEHINGELLPLPEGAQYAQRINIVLDNDRISAINPFSPMANNPPSNWVFTMIYDRLFRCGKDNRIEPDLANSWKTDNWQTYTISLRDDVFFHNGDHFTAQDVVNTIEAARTGTGSAAFDVWRPVKSWRIINDYEIELTLNTVNVDFLFNLTDPVAGIVNKRAMSNDVETGIWVGTGAYTVMEFISGSHVLLCRNGDWWNKESMPVTEYLFLFYVPEIAIRSIILQTGEADLCFGISTGDIMSFMENPDYWTVTPIVVNDIQSINFNMDDYLTSDLYFRLAVLHALDREAIGIVSRDGLTDFSLTDGAFWGYDTEFRNAGIPMIEYNPDKAKEYLYASTYNGEDVEIVTPFVRTNLIAAEMIQFMLAEIGVKSTILATDVPGIISYLAPGNNQSQISILSTTMSANAGSARNAFYPGGTQNRSGFNNPEVAALLDEAQRTPDVDARRDIYYRIQEIIFDFQPSANLFWQVKTVVANGSVGGMILRSDLNRIDLRSVYMVVDD